MDKEGFDLFIRTYNPPTYASRGYVQLHASEDLLKKRAARIRIIFERSNKGPPVD